MLMSVSAVNPLTRMRNEMDQIFNSLWTGFAPPGALTWTGRLAAPAMNVWEEPDQFCIEAELPGFTLGDIEVNVQENLVTIAGQRNTEPAEGAKFIHRERRSGQFNRSFTLPTEVDANQVGATLHNGVLLVKLPKVPSAQPRKIQVKSA